MLLAPPSLFNRAYLITLGLALGLCASRVVATVLILLLLLLLTTAEHGENRGGGHGGSRGLNKTGGSVYTRWTNVAGFPSSSIDISSDSGDVALKPTESIEAGGMENHVENRRTSVLVCSTLGSVASAEDILNVCVCIGWISKNLVDESKEQY